MTGLGERLKEARMKKGYTLDDLQEITKIQKRYLAGIENEEYTGMPGSFYIRAFIKQYAEAVDLDADEMLALYKGSSGKEQEELEEEEQQMAAPTLSRSRTRSTRQFNEVMPKIIVALFIIVILLVLTFLWRHKASTKSDLEINADNPVQVEDQSKPKQEDQGKNDEDKNENDTGNADSSEDKDGDAEENTGSEDEDEDIEADEEQESDEAQTLSHESISGEDSMYKLTDTDTFKIEIRTNGPSWIGVMDENRNELSSEARTMDAGEKLEVDASDVEKVRIRVGRTAETEIYVNGELLDYESDAITQNIHIEYEPK